MFGAINGIVRGCFLPSTFVNGLNAIIIMAMIFVFGGTGDERAKVRKIIDRETKRVYCLLKYPDEPVRPQNPSNVDSDQIDIFLNEFNNIYNTGSLLDLYYHTYAEVMNYKGKKVDYMLSIHDSAQKKLNSSSPSPYLVFLIIILTLVFLIGLPTSGLQILRNSSRIMKMTVGFFRNLNGTHVTKFIKRLNGVGPVQKRTYFEKSNDDTNGMKSRAKETLDWFSKGNRKLTTPSNPSNTFVQSLLELPEAVYEFMLQLPEVISELPALLNGFIAALPSIIAVLIPLGFAIIDFFTSLIDALVSDPAAFTDYILSFLESLTQTIDAKTESFISMGTQFVCSVPALVWAIMLAVVKIPLIIFVNIYPSLVSFAAALPPIINALQTNINLIASFLYNLLFALILALFGLFYFLFAIYVELVGIPGSPLPDAFQTLFVSMLNYLIAILTVGIPAITSAATTIKQILDTFRHNLCDTYDQLVTRISQLSI